MTWPPIRLAPALACALAIAGCALLLPTCAWADYGPGARPASASGNRLSDGDSTSPALSGDGRFVAFQTSSPTLLGPPPDPATTLYGEGMVRRDLLTGDVEQVAPPELLRTKGLTSVPGTAPAEDASISADGRYVLFQTTAALLPGDSNVSSDVYVRDMTKPVTDPAAYELVSALDGTSRAPTYPRTGSVAGLRGASLSDDGRTAVFWTTDASNLPGAGATVTPGPATTPGGQVFVRSLDRRETRLVTRDSADPTLPGTPAGGVSTPPVLSGAGNVVAWLSTTPDRQTRFLPGEPSGVAHYLWRDVTAGPAAVTRRITGASDPDDPACPPDGPYAASITDSGPCFGPLSGEETLDASGMPATFPLGLSDDGMTVMLRSSARPRPADPNVTPSGALFVVDMHPGLSRKQGTRRVLAATAVADVESAVLSGDGREIVFSSYASSFPGLQPLGTFQTSALDTRNVFVIDQLAGTVERVTRAFDGTDYRGPSDVANPGVTTDPSPDGLAVDETGATIAFDASDGNLFVGDVNGVKDVEVVRRASTPPPAVAFDEPPADAAPVALPALTPLLPSVPVIGYPATSPDGIATLVVRVPARGRLTVLADGHRGAKTIRVASLTRKPKHASTVVVRLHPSHSALLSVRRMHKSLSVSVRVRYKPASGAATVVTRRYTLTRWAAATR